MGIGRDCQGIMLVTDYESTVTEIIHGDSKNAMRRVGERFLEILPSMPFSDVSRTKLLALLGKTFQSSPTSSISNLLRIGVLTRKGLSDYNVAIPNTGTFLVEIKNARKEIVSIIKKRMYREILQKELEKKIEEESHELEVSLDGFGRITTTRFCGDECREVGSHTEGGFQS